jgi:acyl dehydratase
MGDGPATRDWSRGPTTVAAAPPFNGRLFAATGFIERREDMRVYENIQDLQPLVGEIIGTSEWLLLEQDRIDMFADATGDHQWIHVDPVRAADGPFGAPIAHGFLTLSLMPAFNRTAFKIVNSSTGINYGLDKVRFPAPVPVGSLVRAHIKLIDYEPLDKGGAQLRHEVTVERQGSDKPVCVATTIVRRYP